MLKVVGKITEFEKAEIRNLNNHKIGLEELIPILDINSDLYKTAILDLDKTAEAYTNWWKCHAEKYRWERGQREWIVLFKTNEIVIEK